MERLYLILDGEGHALSQAVLESAPDASALQVRLLDDEPEDFTHKGEIQLIGLDDGSPACRGFVERQRGSRLVIHTTADLGVEARENLRVATDFRSVIYPVTGRWRGQRAVQGHDLSCGGVAFHTMERLSVGEIAEIVLPVTDEPLLLHFRVLRELPSDTPVPLYAARFIDLILDQEIIIRKAVFGIQVRDLRR
ncbi:MAG: PilZ domain-containing protein [Oscillospiraceae bacterium]|nr:PilZ domain-containing protein [Oscillospiraceae bacterium]